VIVDDSKVSLMTTFVLQFKKPEKFSWCVGEIPAGLLPMSLTWSCQWLVSSGLAVVLQKKYIKLKLPVVVGPSSMGGLIVAIFALQAIWAACSSTEHSSNLKLATWIVIAGVCFGLFAFVVPTLHALRFFSTCSLLLSLIYTCIAIALAISNGISLSLNCFASVVYLI
jgi:hypothetical protein